MKLDGLIKQFSEELELGSSLKALSNVYTIPLEEDLQIKISPLPQGYYLQCVVGPIPQKSKGLFYSNALLANLFGQGTHGAVLGLDSDGNLLTLSLVVDYNPEYKDFRNTLEDFINTIDFWREELKGKSENAEKGLLD